MTGTATSGAATIIDVLYVMKLIQAKYVMAGFYSKKKLRKISWSRSRSPKNPDCCHFTLLFYRGRLRKVQRFTTHVHSHCLARKPYFWFA